MRGVPDVAGNAAEATGYQILCDGQKFPDASKGIPPVGGTSAVAPLWAGLIACINQSLGKPVGFVNPRLYAIPQAAGAFHEITQGTNGLYSAKAGWNPCTGLGKPDLRKQDLNNSRFLSNTFILFVPPSCTPHSPVLEMRFTRAEHA